MLLAQMSMHAETRLLKDIVAHVCSFPRPLGSGLQPDTVLLRDKRRPVGFALLHRLSQLSLLVAPEPECKGAVPLGERVNGYEWA